MVESRTPPSVAALRLALAAAIAFGCISAAAPSHVFAQQRDDSTEESRENTETKKKQGPPIIPIPIFITEPAIGYGLGAALSYFHPRKTQTDSDDAPVSPAFTTGSPPTRTGHKQKRPPNISAVAAAYTENGTWAAGFGHSASWREDKIRYMGAAGYANVESTFFFLSRPFDFNLKGAVLVQDIRFRIASSQFWLGGKLSYLNAEGRLKLGEDAPTDFGTSQLADSGLALQAMWDSRDNTMTPDRGQLLQLLAWRYDDAIGGDYDYWKLGLKLNSFHQFGSFVLGLRLDLDAVSGDPPLWGYPWISIRGVPALRYQNELVGVVETELRWNVFERWAVLGFVGSGGTAGDTLIYDDASGIVAGGVGGRYLFRPEDRLWVGVDIATGPEKTYGYIQVGHAW